MSDKKKPRTIYTPQQICFLEEKFAENDFPSKSQRKKWADYLQLSEQHVQIWFQNKRAKQKRKQKIRANTEKKVHVPKPPPFWPQNLSFNSSLQVIVPDVEADLAPSSNGGLESECEDKTKIPTEANSPVNNAKGNEICSNEVLKTTNRTDSNSHSSQDYTPVSNQNKQRCIKRGKNQHQMQFFSSGFTNGLSSPVSVSYHLKQTIPLYTFKPEVIANPLLLLASCATQLHKAHTTLPANKKKTTEI